MNAQLARVVQPTFFMVIEINNDRRAQALHALLIQKPILFSRTLELSISFSVHEVSGKVLVPELDHDHLLWWQSEGGIQIINGLEHLNTLTLRDTNIGAIQVIEAILSITSYASINTLRLANCRIPWESRSRSAILRTLSIMLTHLEVFEAFATMAKTGGLDKVSLDRLSGIHDKLLTHTARVDTQLRNLCIHDLHPARSTPGTDFQFYSLSIWSHRNGGLSNLWSLDLRIWWTEELSALRDVLQEINETLKHLKLCLPPFLRARLDWLKPSDDKMPSFAGWPLLVSLDKIHVAMNIRVGEMVVREVPRYISELLCAILPEIPEMYSRKPALYLDITYVYDSDWDRELWWRFDRAACHRAIAINLTGEVLTLNLTLEEALKTPEETAHILMPQCAAMGLVAAKWEV